MTAILTRTEAETFEAGRGLGARIEPGTCVLLYGDLGTGKTVFVRGLAAGLGLDPDEVSSPTFTIVQEYRGPVTLQHVDLYRLSLSEVDDLGLDDLAGPDTVIAVEWADRLTLPPTGPNVVVRLAHHNEGRAIEIETPVVAR